jgi:hypothetical protein
LDRFELPISIGDHYGTRARGYLTPEVSGDYTFWIASDDDSESSLGTTANSADRQNIAGTVGWARPGEWENCPGQRSAVIHLEAGQSYYIEAVRKEGVGSDNVAVVWSGTGTAQQVIDCVYLSLEPRTADRDGDGVADAEDALPSDPSEWVDTDDENDSMSDTWESQYGSIRCIPRMPRWNLTAMV